METKGNEAVSIGRTLCRLLPAVLLCLSVLRARPAEASDLVEVLPLTDDILMVHFDDGSVSRAQPGQESGADDVVSVDPLDRTGASNPGAYRISSSDDAAYVTPLPPTSVGRKSKGTEFSGHCDTWNGTCVNTSPDRAMEHWTYLFLPTPLQRGKTYEIDTGTLAANSTTTTITFDEPQLRSEAVHVNTVAYATQSQAKYGYVYHWLGDRGGLDVGPLVGRTCSLVRTSDGEVAFTSTLAFRKDKSNVETAHGADTPGGNFLGADVAECDFSSYSTPGEYVLVVDGVGSSFPFRIDEDAYREPFRAAMKGLFINRSGIAISSEHGDGYSRPAPHRPGVTPGFDGRLKYTTTRFFDVASGDSDAADLATWEAGILGDIDTWGWYQDAGDWDAYFSHSSIPPLLFLLYEQHPDHFIDGELNIPESGNGLPDVLDEGRWLLRFYHRTRHAILDAGYGTGGVGGARVMGDLWGPNQVDGLVAGSWQDTERTWIVSGEDPWMTYRYAAMAAHFAQILKDLGQDDPEGIDWQAEAIAAWDWAQANTLPGDGTAHGTSLAQTRLYAAAALFRLTGTESYHDSFKADFGSAGDEWNSDSRYWLLLYSMMPAGQVDADIQAACHASAKAEAELLLGDVGYDRATRFGGNFYMPMFLGQGSTPLIGDGVLALDANAGFSGGEALAYKSRAYTTADYFLGTNPLNMTWISRLGPRYPVGVFHLDGFTAGDQFPPPGLIPYGPVATARDWMGLPPPGPWASNWPILDVYPADIETWPGHERWFDQRTGIASCEFTVHQTTIVTAVVYGSLLEVPSEQPPMPDGGLPDGDGGAGSGGDGGGGNVEPMPEGGPPVSDGGVGSGGEGNVDSGGCGCRAAPGAGHHGGIFLLLAFALAPLARRRHRWK